MKENKTARSFPAVAAFLMLAVFATAVLLTLITGAGTYRRLTQRTQMAFDSRTATQYLATKVRQASGSEGVSIAPFGQGDCLWIPQNIEGETYAIRVYCHDGWLMELFSDAESIFAPENGERLFPAEKLELSVKDGLLTAVVALPDGQICPVSLHLADAKEDQP